MDLAFHEQRIDHPADVVDDGVADDLQHAGVLVDLDLADLAAVGKRHRGRCERRRLAEAGLHARRLLGLVGGAGHLGEGHAPIGAGHE